MPSLGPRSRWSCIANEDLGKSEDLVETDLDQERQKKAADHGANGRDDHRRQRALPAVRLQHRVARLLRIVIDGDGLPLPVLVCGLFRELAKPVDGGPAPICRGADKVALADLVGVAQIDLVTIGFVDEGFVVVALALDRLLDHA